MVELFESAVVGKQVVICHGGESVGVERQLQGILHHAAFVALLHQPFHGVVH